jgi:hypothetical protein
MKEAEERDLTGAEEAFLATEHKCPICKTGELLGGPCGGLSQNILCNVCCSEFAYCGGLFSTRLMRHDLKRALEVYGVETK